MQNDPLHTSFIDVHRPELPASHGHAITAEVATAARLPADEVVSLDETVLAAVAVAKPVALVASLALPAAAVVEADGRQAAETLALYVVDYVHGRLEFSENFAKAQMTLSDIEPAKATYSVREVDVGALPARVLFCQRILAELQFLDNVLEVALSHQVVEDYFPGVVEDLGFHFRPVGRSV